MCVLIQQGSETLVTKTTVTVPANGGPVEAVSTIETVPYWTRSRRKTGKISVTFQRVKPICCRADLYSLWALNYIIEHQICGGFDF